MSDVVRLLILSDNKPGHVSGSQGVVSSIEKIVPAQAVTLQIRLRLKFMRYPLRLLLNRPGLLGGLSEKTQRKLIRFFYQIQEPQHLEAGQRFDWLISAGGDTSFLNAWVAQLNGIKNIYCSSLRGLAPSLFTLLLSPRTGSAGPNEIKLSMAPKPIDREKIAEQGRQFRSEQKLQKETVWAVLIGGDGAGYRFNRASMELLAKGLLEQAERNHARLLLSTSRRTGLAHEQTLKSCLENHPAVAYATYYNHLPEKVVAKFLGAADLVFCTADSASMITESMTAGKPVYVLAPERSTPPPSHQAYLQKHVDAHHIQLLPIQTLPALTVQQDIHSYFHLLESDSISELSLKLKPWFQVGGTSCA